MQWAPKQKGFTIVELLIVIVVIAILAAITIVAYNGITQRAKDSMAKSGISQTQKKLATYYIEHGETYPSDLSEAGITGNANMSYQFTANNTTTPKGYCVTVTMDGVSYRLGNNFTYTSGSTQTINESEATSGACPGHSSTGGAVVTNYSTNPSFEVNHSGTNEPNNSTRARSTVRAYSGAYSLLVTMPANAGQGSVGAGIYVPSSFISSGLEPNTTYTVTAYVYVPTGTPSVQISIQGSGRASVVNPSSRWTYTKNQWAMIQNTFTTTATDGSISVYALNNEPAPASATQFYVDAVMLTKGTSTPAFADGSTSGWIWNGAAGVSTSNGPVL